MYRPLWIEVDLKSLRHNAAVIRRIVGNGTKILATVKQSAYGHGLIPVARELAAGGMDFFGVGSLEEASSLRYSGISQRILVLTAVLKQYAGTFVEYRVTPTVVDLDFAKALDKEAGRRCVHLPVHVKIDTGMGRLGVYYRQADKLFAGLKRLKNIYLEGIFTHFPVADTDPDFTGYQIAAFSGFIQKLKKQGINFRFQHCANSLGVLKYPQAHFNMVRPGLILYGIKPAPEIKADVRPVLALKSRVVFVKRVEPGMSVSYGRAYIANRPGYIATIAAGYADGYPWRLAGQAKVIIKGRFFPVAGRICMDHVMADLGSRKDIKAGDEVTLIGGKDKIRISAEDLAGWAGTIPYEIASCLSLKLPRVYKNSCLK